MPRLDLNLNVLTQQRQNLVALQAQLREIDNQITKQKAAFEAALRTGQSTDVTEELRVQLETTRAERSNLSAQRRELGIGIDQLADGLLFNRDPAQLTEALDGGQPIALLPMRLETRYFPPTEESNNPIPPDRLRIRVYPDDINLIQHTAALTEAERQAGQDYWLTRFSLDDTKAERIARDLSLTHGRNRCAWILRILTPDNMDKIGQAEAKPQFPNTQTIEASAKQTRALLLPDRWCAIGYASGRREVFRVWGKRIPDELVLSPEWLNVEDSQHEALFDGERAWMVDFAAALDKGMALEVTQQAVNEFLSSRHDPQGFNLANDTLERLLVVGLEWTKDAAQSAEELAELLAAQRDSEGIGFIPLGTPTNNTEVAASGYSRSEEHDPPLTPSENTQLPKEKDALQLLTSALGLPEDKLTADGIQNAHLAEQRTALHMLNALWRGTFGQYLMEQWNPYHSDESERILKTPTLYALRRYVVAYLRPAGALPVLRIGKQPYGVLPVVGKAYSDAGDSKVESGIGKLLGILRPIWEIAAKQKVPLLKDGNVYKAKEILQSNAWSQVAFYRDADPKFFSITVPPILGSIIVGSKLDLINRILNELEVNLGAFRKEHAYNRVHISGWNFFPYPPIELAGVPWVLADSQDPTKEAPAETSFEAIPTPANYLRHMADNISDDKILINYQSGPALLQALLAYSVYMERHDAIEKYVIHSGVAEKISSVSTPRMSYIEARQEDALRFAVNNPQELADVVIPNLTRNATLGQFVAQNLELQPVKLQESKATRAASDLFKLIDGIIKPLRDVSAVKLSLDYLAHRNVGELNWAFKTTLDAFSYRLDAWFSARANRRLEQIREHNPTGIYVGGFAWVENLKADRRPDSEGYLLAPSLGQATSAAILRSGFMANHEQGAFNIELDSQRTRQALDILQGLTRDQPLAALYGYRIERGLRDAVLGKLIWPLRLLYPWRPASNDPSDEPQESVGARDVVDGVALLAAWETDAGATVRLRLNKLITARSLPITTTPNDSEWGIVASVIQNGLDLADSVADLLMAEGVHQIVQGNFERAGAAMAIVDKQSLPIEPQVAKTPRGGASYTQRMALLCPPLADNNWPQDRRSRAEPSLNAWLAHMLGDPTRYQFSVRVFRGKDANEQPIIDHVIVNLQDMGLSPLSAVLSATTVFKQEISGGADTGFRGQLVKALIQHIDNPANVTGLDIQQEGTNGSLGLGHFEALATTLRALLDKARPITRKDLVVPDDKLEKDPNEGEYPGVNEPELRSRADELIEDFTVVKNAVLASADAADLLNNLAVLADFVVPAAWPQQVKVLNNPEHEAEDFKAALTAVNVILDEKTHQLDEPIATEKNTDGTAKPPTHAQLVQKSIDQIKLLLGKDFPVLPRFSLGAYANEFNASLAVQADLTLGNPWQVSGWLSKLARVHEGLDRFAGALSAHEALIDLSTEHDFKVVQYPNRDKQVWAALPEAWRENEETPLAGKAPEELDKYFKQHKVPEELHEYLKQQPGAPYKDINRVVPKLAMALHTPGGLDNIADDTLLAGLVCDEWAEFIPDRFQTAGISFHYDAPGARPPQSILLALPPGLQQQNWQFDQVLDVLHEAFDLAKLRAVRPKDLEGGVGALLPGNYLPQNYTDDQALPSVTLQKLAIAALANYKTSIVPLGKN
jgi:hypothetical protein